MPYRLLVQPTAEAQLSKLARLEPKKHKKVIRCFGLLESDPKHPGLSSHRYRDLDDVHGERIWESYVENRTPSAYRVFWHYAPDEEEITIVAITPHP